jgi:hypothetical protein
MSNEKTCFMVCNMHPSFELSTGHRVKASSFAEGCVGFLPCFDTREQAEKFIGDDQGIEITQLMKGTAPDE